MVCVHEDVQTVLHATLFHQALLDVKVQGVVHVLVGVLSGAGCSWGSPPSMAKTMAQGPSFPHHL